MALKPGLAATLARAPRIGDWLELKIDASGTRRWTVRTALPSTAHIGVSHEGTGAPSTSTKQAPHAPDPQPKRVPQASSWLRST